MPTPLVQVLNANGEVCEVGDFHYQRAMELNGQQLIPGCEEWDEYIERYLDGRRPAVGFVSCRVRETLDHTETEKD
jgi:hypothetical protein